MFSSQPQNNVPASVVLTPGQQVIFKDFIKTMIEDDRYVNLLISSNVYLKADNNVTTRFGEHGGNIISDFRDLSTIPLIPQLSDQLEQFILENPEALNGYLLPAINTGLRQYGFSILNRLPKYLENWALEDAQRAKLIVDKFYQYTNENINNKQLKKSAFLMKSASLYCLAACLAFTVVAIAVPPAAVGWLLGAGMFLVLSLGSAYLAHRDAKHSKHTPLADLANSVEEVIQPASLSDFYRVNQAAENNNVVEVKISLNPYSNEKPVSITIASIFKRDVNVSEQEIDLEEKRELGCR